MADTAKKRVKTEPYIYSGQTSLVANSSGQLPFQIASNFDFMLTRFTFKSSVNSANAIPTFDLQILKNDHGIFLDFAPCEAFAGWMVETSTAPDTIYRIGQSNWYKFDKPYPFEGKSNMIVSLRDTSGQANTVRMVLSGYKLIKFQ
jgi:hypothetical protein